MTFICRPASVDVYIEFFVKKKQEKKFDVNTRVPRRARWDFRGVLNDYYYDFIFYIFEICHQ